MEKLSSVLKHRQKSALIDHGALVNPVQPTTRRILAWNNGGKATLDFAWPRRSVSIGSTGDVDIIAPIADGSTVIMTFDGAGGMIRSSKEGRITAELRVVPGIPVTVADHSWIVLESADNTRDNETQSSGDHKNTDDQPPSGLLSRSLDILTRSMANTWELRRSLREFCTLVTRFSGAASGMIVLHEKNEFSIVATEGLDAKAGQELWEAMPQSVTAGILRSKARLILPEAFRERSTTTTTIFVSGVQSVAGFPILAEGKLLGILHLGFPSLVRDLTPAIEESVAAAAVILGLVMQRAQLREDLSGLALRTQETRALEDNASSWSTPQRLMVGSSAAVQQIYKMIHRLAPVDVSVLVLGETGTGKELVAKELHRHSNRRNKPFVVVNAAAIPENLVESELFGHRKGAFTGAISDRTGLVEQASGGTLFLDEIGELSLPVQAKLLRVLQEKRVTRVGDHVDKAVNFRLVAATHRDLPQLVKEGRFREDLWYRIAASTIQVPPLRERKEDILPLADWFRIRFAKDNDLEDKTWSADAIQALENHRWTGNVRELENMIGRAFVLADGDEITAQDLGIASGASPATPGAHNICHETLNAARDAWMKAFLADALRKHKGRRTETAKALGIGERTLFRYLDQFGIRDP